MTWTSKKPTVPGWYWWRAIVYGRLFSRIYEVELFDGHLGIRAVNRVEFMEGDWAGPIEPPKEAS